jgi:putative copper resistance protein D
MAVAVLFGLYATPLLEASLRSVPLHLGVNLLVLLIGLVFWWSLLGVDPTGRQRPRDQRLLILVGFLALLLLMGARIYFSPSLIAGSWFLALDWPWLEVAVDQRRGAGLWWAGITVLGPLLFVSLADSPVSRPDRAKRAAR